MRRRSVWFGAALLTACSFGGGFGGLFFEDFEDEVSMAAGPGATDCGHVRLGDDRSTANCCVASNFERSLPFRVTFEEQGIDSFVARGLAFESSGRMTEFVFDSYAGGGGRTDIGIIDSRICRDPTLIEKPCADKSRFPIDCS